jgi:hypothetical protein
LTDEYCPAEFSQDITDKLQKAAWQVFDALMLDVYGRMDFIVDGGGEIWCLEGNTLPGLTPISLLPQEAVAAGLSYEDLCESINRAFAEEIRGGKTMGMKPRRGNDCPRDKRGVYRRRGLKKTCIFGVVRENRGF